MSTESSTDAGQDKRPEEIEAEIEETREELGDTVAALAEKTDVKGQAKKKAAETKQQAQAKLDQVSSAAQQKLAQAPEPVQQNPVPIAAGAAAALLAVVWLVRRRR